MERRRRREAAADASIEVQQPAETELEASTLGGTPARARRRREVASPSAQAETAAASGAAARRERRRGQGDGAVESAIGSAGDAVRAAIERISPRRRPNEEFALLELLPDSDDVVLQHGSAAADAIAAGDAGDGQFVPTQAAVTWVEDVQTRKFTRTRTDGAGGTDRAPPPFGLGALGGSGKERIDVLASQARAVIAATLSVSEGVLAGMAVLQAILVDQCEQRAFLLLAYARVASVAQQGFHFLATLALLSALIAHATAGARIAALAGRDGARWEVEHARRAASYQQAAAVCAALLYACALICTLVNAQVVFGWSRLEATLIARLDDAQLAQLYADQFDTAYPQWRALSYARTALCVLAWLLGTAFYARRGVASTERTGVGMLPNAQPSLVASLAAAAAANPEG